MYSSLQPVVSHLHDLSFVLDKPFFSLKDRCPYIGSHGTHKNVASSISINWVASNVNQNALITSLRRVYTASRPVKSEERLGRAAWCLLTWLGDLSRPQFKHFFNALPKFSIFLAAIFVTPSHCNHGDPRIWYNDE